MNTHRIATALAAAALFAAPAAAQLPSTPRALGMGGAYMGVARGQEALFLNPANLALPSSPHWSAGGAQSAVHLGAIGFSWDDLNSLRDYGGLDDAERQALVDAIPASGTMVDVDLQSTLFAMSIRRFAVGVGYRLLGDHSLNKSVADLVLNGFELGRTYSSAGSEGFRAAYWDVAAAYGHRIGPVSFGATAHYLIANTATRAAFVQQDTVFAGAIPSDVRVTYEGVRMEGGSGFGLDLGVASEPIPGLIVSASVANVVNTLTWDEGMRVRSVTLDRDDYETGDAEAILARFQESETDYVEGTADPDTRVLATRLAADGDAGLPAVLRLGAGYQLRTGTTVAGTYQQELGDDNALGGVWSRRLGVGVQQSVSIVSLRAGLASNLDDGTMLTGGIGLGPLQIGVARISTGSGDASRKGWILTAGLTGRSDSVMP